jgi:hypothetical protein
MTKKLGYIAKYGESGHAEFYADSLYDAKKKAVGKLLSGSIHRSQKLTWSMSCSLKKMASLLFTCPSFEQERQCQRLIEIIVPAQPKN